MRLELEEDKLRALPAQRIVIPGGVVLKRGRNELRIVGEGAAQVLESILRAASTAARTRAELCELVPPAERERLSELINALLGRRLLVPASEEAAPEPETPEDVFYWHFGQSTRGVGDRLIEVRPLLVGVNTISRRLLGALRELGWTGMAILDEPALRNPRLFDPDGALCEEVRPLFEPLRAADGGAVDPESFDVLVATSDFGGLELLRPWNELCVVHKRPFLPIVLQDLVGQVGPLMIPGETACLECYRMRRATHLADLSARRAIEAAVSTAQAVGFLPPMAGVLGDLGAMELLKYFGLGPPTGQVGVVLEANLVAGDVTARTVLRMPRCPVCTPLSERPSVPATRGSAPSALRGGA